MQQPTRNRRFTLVSITAGIVLLAVGCSSKPPELGEEAFQAACNQINAYDKESQTVGFGNTSEAETLADHFSKMMQVMEPMCFEGGYEKGRISLTDENFITYCELHENSICFLVHVPQLKNYKKDVRDTLIQLAWKTATSVTQGLRSNGDRKIAVGLRGAIHYGGLAIGMGNEEPETENGYAVNRRKLYGFFIDSEKTVVKPSARQATNG